MHIVNNQPDNQEIDERTTTLGMIALFENKLEEITGKITILRQKDESDLDKWESNEDARFAKWSKENDDRAREWIKKNPNGGKIFGGPQQPDPSPYPQFVSKYGDEIEKLHLEKRQLEREIAALKNTVAQIPEKYERFNTMNRTQQQQLFFTSLKKIPDFKKQAYYIFNLDEDLSVVALTGNESDGWATFTLMTSYQAKERKRQLTEQGNQVTEVYELDRRLVGFDERKPLER